MEMCTQEPSGTQLTIELAQLAVKPASTPFPWSQPWAGGLGSQTTVRGSGRA